MGGRPFGMFVIKGGKSVPRGHVRLKSPPSESHRYEIQPDTLDLPPLSHPSAGPRGNPAQGPKTTRKPSLVLGKKRASSLLEKKTLSRVGKEKGPPRCGTRKPSLVLGKKRPSSALLRKRRVVSLDTRRVLFFGKGKPLLSGPRYNGGSSPPSR